MLYKMREIGVSQVKFYLHLFSIQTRTAFFEDKNVLQNKAMHVLAAVLVAAWGR